MCRTTQAVCRPGGRSSQTAAANPPQTTAPTRTIGTQYRRTARATSPRSRPAWFVGGGTVGTVIGTGGRGFGVETLGDGFGTSTGSGPADASVIANWLSVGMGI